MTGRDCQRYVRPHETAFDGTVIDPLNVGTIPRKVRDGDGSLTNGIVASSGLCCTPSWELPPGWSGGRAALTSRLGRSRSTLAFCLPIYWHGRLYFLGVAMSLTPAWTALVSSICHRQFLPASRQPVHASYCCIVCPPWEISSHGRGPHQET